MWDISFFVLFTHLRYNVMMNARYKLGTNPLKQKCFIQTSNFRVDWFLEDVIVLKLRI
jgi:hypothetical protein